MDRGLRELDKPLASFARCVRPGDTYLGGFSILCQYYSLQRALIIAVVGDGEVLVFRYLRGSFWAAVSGFEFLKGTVRESEHVF